MSNLFRMHSINNFAGVRMTETSEAMVEPNGKPHTDDMRDMIDHMRRLGLIQKKPGAFMLGDRMFVHPQIMRGIEDRLRRDLDRMSARAFLGGVR